MRNLYKYTAIYTNGGEPELIEGDTFKAIIPLPTSVTPRVTDGVTDGVTDKEQAVLNCISKNPAITSTEMAESLKVSRKTISARIKALKEKGIIERIGSDNNGHWQIK